MDSACVSGHNGHACPFTPCQLLKNGVIDHLTLHGCQVLANFVPNIDVRVWAAYLEHFCFADDALIAQSVRLAEVLIETGRGFCFTTSRALSYFCKWRHGSALLLCLLPPFPFLSDSPVRSLRNRSAIRLYNATTYTISRYWILVLVESHQWKGIGLLSIKADLSERFWWAYDGPSPWKKP